VKTLVVIPTYNERDNVGALIERVFHLTPETHILVVDDNSPDQTAAVVQGLQPRYPNLHLLVRPGKSGLGRAYVAGFSWGLERGYDRLVEMDADFSHRPEDLVGIIEAAKTADVVVGSRWVQGGGTVNWGLGRKIISRGGSLYSRVILGYPLTDWTGGFNAWKADVLRTMPIEEVRSEGYSFQIELKYKALSKGHSVVEYPILFEDRRVGQSKMSSRIVFEALYRVWKIRLASS
jgi:dolichol-phosphate mannosyltransferase